MQSNATIVTGTGHLSFAASGTVTHPTSPSVGGLSVQIVDKNAGPDVPLAETTTNDDGTYAVAFDVERSALAANKKTQPDLQARVSLGSTFLAASAVRYGAQSNVVLNVTIPATVTNLPSEYETLTRTLAQHYAGALGALQENGERTDITYLANKTGWDARAVALAALADQFATKAVSNGAKSLRPELYYALFRSGLPANGDVLYRAAGTTVAGVWNQAISQRVIPASLSGEIDSAVAEFQKLGAATLLDAIPAPNTSSMRALLQISLGDDAQRLQQFATLYTQHQGDLPAFWSALQKVFGETTTKRLQLDGQLAYLTLNNAPLISNLHQAESAAPPSSLLDLVRRGYYQTSKWEPLMNGVSVEQVNGTTLDDKQANYLALLTTQLRLSYPTAVLAEMVNANTVPLTTDAALRTEVYQFLVRYQGAYELGMIPIDQFISENKLTVAPELVAQIKTLQRVYQITPNDTAMNALLAGGVTSAYAIAHYGHDAFVREFATAMGGEDVAGATFAQAQSVYNTVLNVTTDYLSRRVAPTPGNGTAVYLGPFPYNGNRASISNTAAAATLETLFGSMDYCACDECRSILGPAAYLVDLLNQTNCQSPPPGSANPQSVLFARRPDLANLPLTCDNTNTAMPYIDIVNETLEYYVANGSLNGFQGFNTDASVTTSAQLIAAPQNVNDAAYATLKSALFPPPLPFDRSLEILRLLFGKFDVDLQDAMAALRPSDAVERPAGPTAYGWRDILMEEIGLSREEYQLLTDSTLTLEQIYGYPAAMTQAQTVAALSIVSDYAQRLNVEYADLLSILQTHFINPASTLLPQLESLNVSFAAIAGLKNGTLSPAAFLALLPTGPAAPNPADFGGDIAGWVTDPARYAQIMGLITISNPSNSTDLCSMDGLQFTYANPDPSANTLQPIEFVRLLRFIRLWNELGLTIQQTDDIISALAPSIGSVTSLAQLDTAFLQLLPRIGFAYRVMDLLGLDASDDIENLLPLWGDIGVYGSNSLYASMFLNPTMLAQDPAFAPDENGNVLEDATQTIMATPTSQKAVVGGTPAGGDVLTTTINNVPVAYTVAAADSSPALLAASVAAALNATTTIDPVTGQPLNAVVSASASGAVVTFAAIGSGGAFSLACSVSPGATETYLSLDHSPALRAAFALTAAEFTMIAQFLNYTSTTVLNLANISAIYRYGWLARQLEISVAELLLLIHYTGLNPFAPPDPSATPPAEPPVIWFIRLVQAMSDASLQPVQPLYLLWNQDLSGTSAPTQDDINALAFTLRGDFAAVDAQFTIVDDPTGSIATSLMTLVYGATATNFFFGLLNDTVTVSVPYGDTVPPAVLTAATGRLSYDAFAKQLTYAGVLDAPTLAALQSAAAGNAPLLTALTALSTANQALVGPFFTQYPALLAPYQVYVASSGTLQNKRNALLAGLLPPLESARKQEQALAAVSAAAGIDTSFATALFTNASAMQAAATPPGQEAIVDLTAIEAQGLSVAFFLTNDTSLPPDQTLDTVPSLVYAAGSGNTLPPGSGGSTIAGIWSGYLDCPQDGYYNVSIATDPGAAVALVIDGTPVTLAQSGAVWTNSSAISLTAGDLASIVLSVSNVTSTLSVSWASSAGGGGIGWQPIPGQYLYSQTLVARLGTSYTRFLKGASLATALALDANELTFLATDPDYQVGGANWLNVLPITGSPDGATSSGLYQVLDGFLTFARLKQALSPSDERFLTLLENPAAQLANGQSALLTLTQWDQQSLDALLVQFFGSTSLQALAHLSNFARVFDAYAVVTASSIGAQSLITATTNAPAPQTVVDFEAAVRARYAESDWLDVIQPINDSMRTMQRDALVPYVLQLCAKQNAVVDINTPVTTSDTLFEYLLMDVEMQPCMLTSRIRLALSSVQLFIERSIRGLERNATDPTKNVDPSFMSPSMWTWMKRYRVWEANREVFLWPENWLYPELRDDQTPFFQTITSKLLQSDITDQTAAYAYLEYLSDLQDVAKLEPCTMYYEPSTSSSPASNVYVVARTSGSKRTHYFRSYDGASWTPWQQIPLAIEDKPLVLTVWNDRLMLFWFQVVQQPGQTSLDSGSSSGTSPDLTKATLSDLTSALTSTVSNQSTSGVTISLNLYWSEYYNGKWQPARSSDTNQPALFLSNVATSGPSAFDRSQMIAQAYLDPDPSQDRLWVAAAYSSNSSFYAAFCLYNTHSLPVVATADFPSRVTAADPYWFGTEVVQQGSAGTFDLLAYYRYDSPTFQTLSYFSNDLIRTKSSTIVCGVVNPEEIQPDPGGASWSSPFFYFDTQNAFYVTAGLRYNLPWIYGNYGLVSYLPPPAISLAPIVLKNAILLDSQAPPVDPIETQVTVGSVNTTPIARYVTEDAYITRGLGSTGAVQFGSVEIGISGGIANGATPATTSSNDTGAPK